MTLKLSETPTTPLDVLVCVCVTGVSVRAVRCNRANK